MRDTRRPGPRAGAGRGLALAAVLALAGASCGEPRLAALRVRATPLPTPSAAPTPRPVLQALVEGELAGRPACFLARRGPRELVAYQPDLSLHPASTQKLFVALAALAVLGPQHRLRTRVVSSDGSPDELWVVGGGDPLLATPEYQAYLAPRPRWRGVPTTSIAALADGVVAAGVRAVRVLYADETRHETLRALPGWRPAYRRDGSVGPLGALVVDGGWRQWGARFVPAEQPALHAAGELARLLRARGVEVGGVDLAPAPAGAKTVAEVASAPLQEVVGGMLRASDNLAAELLVREVGRARRGEGTTAAGTAAVVDELRRAGVPTAGVVLADGSGLHPADRATCRALVDALDRGDLGGMLAVAGESGTLAGRFRGSPLQGRLRAKTGWVRGTVGLVGELVGSPPTRVAVLQNGVASLGAGQAAEGRLLAALQEQVGGP